MAPLSSLPHPPFTLSSTQVYKEVRRFVVPAGLSVAAIFGGSSLKQQIAELKRCPEVVVCTPGRMVSS